MKSKGLTKHTLPGILKSKRKNLASFGTLIGLIATFLFPVQKGEYIGASLIPYEEIESEELGAFPITIPTIKYGFALDTFEVIEDKVKRNQTLGTLLSDFNIDAVTMELMIQNSKGVFDINRNFRQGNSYTLLTKPGEDKPDYLVLEPDVYEYVVFDLKGGMGVRKVEHEIETKTASITGSIESSLWEAVTRSGVSFEAAAKMEDALQWSVDFSHTQKGDEFKLVYDEKYIGEKAVGAGQVYVAFYKREGKEFYAFWFDNDEYEGYYDLEGRPASKGFLSSPVKYTRISSNYNKRRFHPVLKYVRPHLGTDYAAPTGTPIYAVGAGTVEEAAYTRGNGKYVKIKHDKTFQTQYLHMSRFAKGIRRGASVKQGEVIGYVGSTGLATGPHVCFRFWKNGRQVNHLKLDLPKPKQLPTEALNDFYKQRDKYFMLLKGEPFNGASTVPELLKGMDTDTAGNRSAP